MSVNELTIAVAGSRKTQGIVDKCATAGPNKRILVVAYTTSSQQELVQRIGATLPLTPFVEVLGWYQLLLRHFVGPYLPLLFPGQTLRGFNYAGDPGRYAKDEARFLDPEGRAYACNLASLAHKVNGASDGSILDRLEHIYTDVYIDEAQDIGGWALEILDVLFDSNLNVHLVGDMRQALLSTDPQSTKNVGYKFEKVIDWYQKRSATKQLTIARRSTTYRSNQEIATLSDKVFDPSCGYEPTVSASTEHDAHTGLFRVAPADVTAYCAAVKPLALHWRSDLGADLGLNFMTFGVCKGRTVDHVLILPTARCRDFLRDSRSLDGRTACSFYIGITRARHSVAFILDPASPSDLLSDWHP